MRPPRPALIVWTCIGDWRDYRFLNPLKPVQFKLPGTPEASSRATRKSAVNQARPALGSSAYCDGVLSSQCMYAQKFLVNVLIRGERRACPLEWLDQFSMRNFTNSADFDDTLPVGDGKLEASFRLTPERFAEGLAAWLTQRGKGEGQPVQVEVKVL